MYLGTIVLHGNDDDGSIKVIDNGTTPGTVTPSNEVAQSTVAIAGPSWEL